MYELLGFCLALVALLAFNAFASLMAAALWRALGRFTHRWSAITKANVLFTLRILPPASAALCVLMLVAPAYIEHEPRITTETVSLKLAAMAFISVMGLMLALWRGFVTWRATQRLVADWLRHAEPISLENISIPAYRVTHRFPIVAVVGAFRPRLFIADQIFDTLSAEELRSVVAHEYGHLAARDNFKRALVRACRDVLMIVPCGRSLDSAWAESAESAADEYAACAGGPQGTLDLAGAMIKIARAVPLGAKPTLPAGAFLLDRADGEVVRRVRRLTELATTVDTHQSRRAFFSSLILWSALSLMLIAVFLMVTNTQILMHTHDGIERIVSALQ
ncbi:MAG TPA: M48 family metalloprotease [Pyrinomonadaceae bacterium]